MRIVCGYTTLHLSASFKLDRLYPERDLSSFLPFYTQSSVAGENQASSKKGHGKALLLTLVIGVPNHYQLCCQILLCYMLHVIHAFFFTV